MPKASMAMPRTEAPRCEICGGAVDVSHELVYPRAPKAVPSVRARGLEQCSECGRLGCPKCLCVVDERADDFFFDVFLCLDCLGPISH